MTRIRVFTIASGAVAVLLTGVAAMGFADPTAAQSSGPAAIVEEVSYQTNEVLEFDYLFHGREISVPQGHTLVIGYLSSCMRETVTGGTIRIGDQQSEGDAAIAREAMDCAGASIVAGADAQATALTAIFRGGERSAASGERPVNSTLPVFLVPHNAPSLSISRLDADAPEINLEISGGGVLDLARANAQPLSPGGVYFASAGASFVEFAVAKEAKATGGPATPRLVRLR